MRQEHPSHPLTRFNSLPVLLGVGIVSLLLTIFALYHFSVSEGPKRFPVILHSSILEERKKDSLFINASVSLHGIEEAIGVVNRIDPKHVFSISNPPLPKPERLPEADPRNFDHTRLIVLAGENNQYGRSRYTSYILRVQGDTWIIEHQEPVTVERDP